MGIDKSTYDRSIVDQGYSWYYSVTEVGYKYHMSDIAATLGLVQLRKLERTNARRKEIVEVFNREFSDLSWLSLPVEKPGIVSAHHNYVLKVENGKRDSFITHMAEHGVATSVHYIPNHLYDMYEPYRRTLPVTEQVWRKLVTLPLFPGLTQGQIDQIISAVRAFKG